MRQLASACASVGDTEGARDACRHLLDAYPHLTIAYLTETLPQAAFTYELSYFSELREAGVPLK